VHNLSVIYSSHSRDRNFYLVYCHDRGTKIAGALLVKADGLDLTY
jgi:hypothetical protein